MSAPYGYERPGIAGSGVIACGLAGAATQLGEVRLLARSDASAWRAEEQTVAAARKIDGARPERVRVTTNVADLAGCDLVVEAIAELPDAKVELLSTLAANAPDADLASTTSSLSLAELGRRGGAAERFFGLHVFNPVERMELVELCLPDGLARASRSARANGAARSGRPPSRSPIRRGSSSTGCSSPTSSTPCASSSKPG